MWDKVRLRRAPTVTTCDAHRGRPSATHVSRSWMSSSDTEGGRVRDATRRVVEPAPPDTVVTRPSETPRERRFGRRRPDL